MMLLIDTLNGLDRWLVGHLWQLSVELAVLATVVAASTRFLTPVGHQANILVFGPGGYRFFDYTRVGRLTA